MMVSVVRTTAWGMGQEDDVWPVELAAGATVAELKAKIEELYDVPVHEQKLANSGDAEAPALDDGSRVSAALQGQRIYLQPAFAEDMEQLAAGFFAAAQENMEMSAAVVESLQGVSYKVHFHRPETAGGQAAGKRVTLTLDALSVVGDVQQIVEMELFGTTGSEPAFLVFEGNLLPEHLTIYHCGLEDGKTVEVVKDRPPPSEAEQLMGSLLAAGAGYEDIPQGALGDGGTASSARM